MASEWREAATRANDVRAAAASATGAPVMRSSAALALLLLAACPQQKKPDHDPNVVAVVNGQALAKVDFERELGREARAMEGGTRTPEQLEPFKQALLDTVIERTVLLQAAKELGLSASQEEIDGRVLALASEYPTGGFEEALAHGRTTKQELERRTRDAVLIEKLFQGQVFDRIALTEAEIRAAYEAKVDEFSEPEQVHAAQIVVKGLDEAKRLQQQLWAGKKFQDLARRYSLAPEAKVGGDLGFFAKGQMPPAFDEVFRLSVGQVSEVISTDYGFHLFKVLEKRPARKRELNEVREVIEKRLLSDRKAQAQRAFVDGLKAKATVKVNDAALATVVLSAPAPVEPDEPAP